MLVLAGIDAVDAVIARHKRLDAALPDSYLKCRQVYFAQSALVKHGVNGHAPQLLRICGIVLDAGIYPLRLYAADQRRRHLPCEKRILGVILKISSA